MTAVPDDLDAAIAGLYGGPPDEFVAGRQALARALRSAGRRDEAAAVAKLRKPRRVAWSLDAAVAADPALAERLAAAAGAVGEAQAAGDRRAMRTATATLRDAAQELAAAAGEAAAAAGHPADDPLLPAVLAVVTDPDGLADLRAGRLVDVPAAGGFGPLADLPAVPPAPRAEPRAEPEPPEEKPTEEDAAPPGPDPAAVAAARRSLAAAEKAAAAAVRRAEVAERGAQRAVEEAEGAERRLRRAEEEAERAAERRDHARQAAEEAAEDQRAAEEALALVQEVLDQLGG